jgi:hypothetical protein
VSGFWPVKEIGNIVNTINPTMELRGELIGYERLELIANDIDVFHGSDSDGGEMKVLFPTCTYHTLGGINEEVIYMKSISTKFLTSVYKPTAILELRY